MKSILVIDTPTTCAGCCCYDYIHGVCAITYKDCELRIKPKPTWCPLRPLPQKIKTNLNDYYEGLTDGWNDCIDKITGETNGKEKLL